MSVKYILMALEVLLLFLFLVPLPIICSGNLAGIIASLILLVVTANWQSFKNLVVVLWSHGAGKAIIIFAGAFIVLGIIYVSILSVLMIRQQENKPDEPNVIVVLGCKVNGTKPSRMLRRRLDTAYEAMEKNPETLCIVSGGQGDNEKVSEASAMKQYLLDKGADEIRIIVEDKSTSTYENIKYSLEILDEKGMSHDMTIITDGFHQYRASLIAKAQGVEDVTSYSAKTEPRFLFTYWVREWLGLTHFFVFGN